jgi:hypothetical protein
MSAANAREHSGILVHPLHAAEVLVRVIDLSQRSDWQGEAGAGCERTLCDEETQQPRCQSWQNHLFVISTMPSLETVPKIHPMTLCAEGGAAGRRL